MHFCVQKSGRNEADTHLRAYSSVATMRDLPQPRPRYDLSITTKYKTFLKINVHKIH